MKASYQRPRPSIACRACCLTAIALLIPQAVLADIVALKNGTRFQGTVANRDIIAKNPEQVDHVAILIDETQEYKTILAADIDFVLLVDGDEKRLIEFTPVLPTAPKPLSSADAAQSAADRKSTGIAMLALGGGLAIVGAVAKFGGEKVTVTESGIDYDEKSYNTANYVLMIGGAALAVAGLVVIVSASEKSDDTHNAFLELRGDETRVGIAVGF